MKHILLATIFILSTLTLSAQPQEREKRGGNHHKFQMELIISQLDINGEQKDQFADIYSRYSEEIKQLHPRKSARNKELTEEQIEEQILQSFETADKINSLKKEYYEEFRKVLNPHQILKMYSVERRFKERMSNELQRRANGKQRGSRDSAKQ